MLIKLLLILLGTIFLTLGFVGVFLPGLPTTPFLLLSAGFYFRSSERMYNWLLNRRLLGPYIKNYQEKKAISLVSKIISIITMWVMITISIVFIIEIDYVKIITGALGIIGTVVLLLIPTDICEKG